jgi:transcriptional regulator with XRE-family HTH domain
MFNLGKQIRDIRTSKNITASWLASKIGVAQSFISGIENGTKKCSFENLEKICSALEITLADFFNYGNPDLPSDLRQLLHEAKKLTPEQRKKLIEFIRSILD